MNVYVKKTGLIVPLPNKINGGYCTKPSSENGIYQFDTASIENIEFGSIAIHENIAGYELPPKGILAKENNWITAQEMANQNIYGYNPLELVFRIEVEHELVQYGQKYFELGNSIRNQQCPTKRVGSKLYAFLQYLNNTDGFARGNDNEIICQLPNIYVTQLTYNLELVESKIQEKL